MKKQQQHDIKCKLIHVITVRGPLEGKTLYYRSYDLMIQALIIKTVRPLIGKAKPSPVDTFTVPFLGLNLCLV